MGHTAKGQFTYYLLDPRFLVPTNVSHKLIFGGPFAPFRCSSCVALLGNVPFWGAGGLPVSFGLDNWGGAF
ncbi:MAG: hypothetical protein CM15mP120_10080 [Pseudomonadota bacterium]|nr:MAG: hypothetical protein CM15mP120_10080 [Pseudomonadota bacterium]